MRYNCQVWGLANNYITKRILILQKAAVRIITFSPFRAHSAPLFSELKILTIFDLVKILNVLFVHKVLNKDVPDEVHNYFKFKMNNHEHKTRGWEAGCLEIPNVHTNSYGISSLSYQCIINWNAISRTYVNSVEGRLVKLNRTALKQLLTKHYSSQYH